MSTLGWADERPTPVPVPEIEQSRLDELIAMVDADGGTVSGVSSAARDRVGLLETPDLGRLLRQLRRREARQRGDAEMTYRQLAKKTGWSHSVIAQYFAGKIVPPTDRFDVLIRLLGATPAEQGVLATTRDRVEEYQRTPSSTSERTARAGIVGRQLPADPCGFVGRHDLLDELDASRGAGRYPPAVVSAVSGMPGVGKTTLAVHWAWRTADRFPDGQLYVNLRGFDRAAAPMSPVDALDVFFTALQVAPDRVPAGLDARVGLYRSLLADRRMLVVLDNARNAEHIETLLPAASGCHAVVTSRDQLTGLVSAHGAHLLTVDPLAADEAWLMLARRLGSDRVAAEPRAVREIVVRCARLPLALAIVAARAASNPTFPLAVLADELCPAQTCLDALSDGGPATDVRAAFSWSYRTLSGAAARLFRLLGQHPGPEVTVPAAARLAGIPTEQTRLLLAELTRAHLIEERTPGRYTVHDLLRGYAAELARTHDGGDRLAGGEPADARRPGPAVSCPVLPCPGAFRRVQDRRHPVTGT